MAFAPAGTPQAPATTNNRSLPHVSDGPPKGPTGWRVSTSTHGAAVKKLVAGMLARALPARFAITIPTPASRSGPAASMSIAVVYIALWTWLPDGWDGRDLRSAAMAPAWGAAADVPQNGLKPGV